MGAPPRHGVVLGMGRGSSAAARPGERLGAGWAVLTVGNTEGHIDSVLWQHCLDELWAHRASWHPQFLQCLLDFIFTAPAGRGVGACTQRAVVPGDECGAGLESCQGHVFGAAGVQEEGELLQEQTHPFPLPQEGGVAVLGPHGEMVAGWLGGLQELDGEGLPGCQSAGIRGRQHKLLWGVLEVHL